ncbi:hypothetical protein NL368_27985, partial [Klebsiella pneumoniae]|nr:hypothetical protein [Klebsiella pneumoniae]
ESNIQTFYSVATGLATAVNANANMQAQIGTTCLKDAVPSSTCWTTFITGFGLKAYRRPLTATEVATVNAVVADATSKAEKISA